MYTFCLELFIICILNDSIFLFLLFYLADKILRIDSISKNVINTEYAVRGELVMRAEQHATTLALSRQNKQKNPLPFDEIVFCNIGNPHALKQKPLTFFRQVSRILSIRID